MGKKHLLANIHQRSACTPNMNAELTQEHTKTDESCTKAGGLSCILKLLKRTGKTSTKTNGLSAPNPNCQNGSENAQAKRPESQNLLKMMTKEVPKPQQKLKKKKRNKSFIIHTASSSYKIRRKKF